jgi:tetratricopeptide (TPR) repeat protein
MFALLFRVFAVLCGCSLLGAATDLDREIVFTPPGGAGPEDREIVRHQQRAQAPAATAEAFERLAWAYVAKARHTLDVGYYKLAEKTVDVTEARFGVAAESRLLRGHVFHQLHRFAEAEKIARSLVQERGTPADLALLSDALMEQGQLPEAIATLQRLVNAKPGMEALSRIAQVRWLKGDVAGAIVALEDALAASAPSDGESRAWLLVRLSALRLQQGDTRLALKLARMAGERVENYAPALLAQGRAQIAQGSIAEALPPLKRAAELQPLPEYQWWFADALRAEGNIGEAEAIERALIGRGAESDPRTLALFLATRGVEHSRALKLARSELARRGDVFSHDALAWTAFAAGEPELARESSRAALVEGTQDARLFLHAGEIARAAGESDQATRLFAQAQGIALTLTPSERAWLAHRIAGAAELAAK